MRSSKRPRSIIQRLTASTSLVAIVIAGCNQAPTPPPSTPPPVALAPIEVTGVGDVRQGRTSEQDVVIRITELEKDSIAAGPGSVDLVLTDSAGAVDSAVFTGSPEVTAPGSLGVRATLASGNILTIEIVDSDSFNVEQLTVKGLRISVAQATTPGPLRLTITNCTGSLAGCAGVRALPSPGTVVAGS